MKVLIVFNKYEYRGGEDTYVSNLIKLLKSRGHTVVLFTKDSRDIKTILQKVQVAFGLFWSRHTVLEFQKLIDTFQPDIAHFHNIFPLIPAWVYNVCKQNGVRVIQTIHNYKHICPKNDLYRKGAQCTACIRHQSLFPSIIYGCYHRSRFASFFYVLSYMFHSYIGSFRKIDAFIFPSLFTLRIYSQHSLLPSKKFYYLPYVTHSVTRRKNKPLPFFLYAGRLTEEKGVIKLIQAFIRNKKTNLHIVGDGPLRREVQQLAQKNRNVVYIGQKNHKEVVAYMRSAMGLIVPSEWYEVLPNVILEARVSGIPVWIPYKNQNLRLISQSSTQIYTYSSFNDLFTQLMKKNKRPKHLASHIVPLEKLVNASFHYKKLMQIYKNVSVTSV